MTLEELSVWIDRLEEAGLLGRMHAEIQRRCTHVSHEDPGMPSDQPVRERLRMVARAGHQKVWAIVATCPTCGGVVDLQAELKP